MVRLGAVLIVLALSLAACGGGDNGGASSQPSSSSGGTQNASAQGKTVFTSNCKGCHTLKAAGATGSVGPNLDDVKPDKATVQRQGENGGGPNAAVQGQPSGGAVK